MRNFWIAFGMTVSMFTLLPLPRTRWEERLRPLATALLPLVGLGIGAVWWGIALLARGLPTHLRAALVAAAPWLLTGFIHIDGFMDASDALLSWRSRQERQRILKDVHVGAFAVISLALLAMFQFAASMDLKSVTGLPLLPVLSRCASSLCALNLHPLGHSEYAGMANSRRLCLIPVCICALAMAALILLRGWRGLLVGVAELAGYAAAMGIACHSLGGFSGDLAGYALTIGELCGLLAMAL